MFIICSTLALKLICLFNLKNFKIHSAILSAVQEIPFLTLTGFDSNSLSLLWRASRDGYDPAAFHRLCDGKANTVTVIKNTNGYIFGGFTSVPWSSTGGYKTDSTAFLFSLTNPSNTPLKLKVKSPQNAVYHSCYGPTFGSGEDLYVSSSSNTNRNSSMYLDSYEFPHGISILTIMSISLYKASYTNSSVSALSSM